MPEHTPYKLKLVSDVFILHIIDTSFLSSVKSRFSVGSNCTIQTYQKFEDLLEAANVYRNKSNIKLEFYNEKTFEHIDLKVQFTTSSHVPTQLSLI
jgi:hypothetical protein